MYYAYILKSIKTGKHYIGSTKNIEQRLKKHNARNNMSTKYGVPWILIHKEEFLTKQHAYKRECQIKRYKGGQAFKKLISNRIK